MANLENTEHPETDLSVAHPVTLWAQDGQALAATCFEPHAQPVLANVVFLPGIGVPQRVFRALGCWLASEGIRALSFDYRGLGRSTAARAFASASLSVWATQDAPAALDYVRTRFDDDPVLIAHSFGGQALGLTSDLHRVRGAILVGAQLAHPHHWHGLDRLRVELLWRVLLPLAHRLSNPIPRWMIGEPLPAGVAREWSHWGRSGDWLLSCVPGARERYAAFSAPILSYGAWDDKVAPPSAVNALLDCFTGTRPTRVALQRADLATPRVGHFGLLRSTPGRLVWPDFKRFVLECQACRVQ
ncbi:MAG TPA: alpha/beta fold hydrolase [Polyangiaceae bacterium]|jgi:predicted alpha/beta hydrolase|nr:alpha/beta fold hydrolase [Polyangiaceae bacterium]